MMDPNVSRTRSFSPGRDEQDNLKRPTTMTIQWEVYDNVIIAREDAEKKALDSLGRYKFEMFGYWASSWVKYNALLPKEAKIANPFADFVKLARVKQEN